MRKGDEAMLNKSTAATTIQYGSKFEGENKEEK